MVEDTKDVKDHMETNDETLLLVSGNRNWEGSGTSSKEYIKKLANAILQVYEKHDSVKMRCVGAGALNNAVKSFIIASEEFKKKEDAGELLLSPSFTTVDFNGDQKTGIVFEVIEML